MKWSGVVGYECTRPNPEIPDAWESTVVERPYFGDHVQNVKWRPQSVGDSTIDTYVQQNIVSIVADEFAYENFDHILYVENMGIKWLVSNAEIKYPRIILTTGGKYDGGSYRTE